MRKASEHSREAVVRWRILGLRTLSDEELFGPRMAFHVHHIALNAVNEAQQGH
jgi:hypothetical protein